MNESQHKAEATPRLTVVGGFLGAGKTTAIARLGAFLKQTAVTVGVITTASGGAAVDTLRLKHAGLQVEELPAGFLRPDSVARCARSMRADHYIVEAPGSSIGLRSLLNSLHAEGFAVSPLTVIVDPVRAAKVLGTDGKSRFSEKVNYLYRKQIEEADLLLLNGFSSLTAGGHSRLRSSLEREFSDARVLSMGRANGDVEGWLTCLTRALVIRGQTVTVEPERYAQAVTALAALNMSVKLSLVKYFDGNKTLLELAGLIQNLLRQEAVEIAHLKMLLAADSGEIASVHATNSDSPPELLERQTEPIQFGRMVLNLRAEGDPEILNSAVNRALLGLVEKSPDLFARMEEALYFRPEPPVPAKA